MGFLTQSIKSNIPITDYAQRLGFTITKAGNQFSLKEHDSVRINPEQNTFYRHATQRGGSVIDFCMEFQGKNQSQAISELRGMLNLYAVKDAPQQTSLTPRPAEQRILELPQQVKGRFSRVFAYLTKSRMIDGKVVSDLCKRQLLYEDERHNCVFVGRDKEGVPAYGAVRGTNSEVAYRGDCKGSRKAVGWYVNNQAATLFVCEAPIDAMSIMTLCQRNALNPQRFDFLALGGVSDAAVTYHLTGEGGKRISTIYLATDNDEAGNKARSALRKTLIERGFKGKILDKPPLRKDWNEDLKALGQPSNERNIGAQQPGKLVQKQIDRD